MALPSFTAATMWHLYFHIKDDTGGDSYLSYYLRNVASFAAAQTAADSVVDKLEALIAGRIYTARLGQEISDLSTPDPSASTHQHIKIIFTMPGSDLGSTSIPTPKSSTTGGVLVDSNGNVNQINPQLDAWRQEFLAVDGFLTLSDGLVPNGYETSKFQPSAGAIW